MTMQGTNWTKAYGLRSSKNLQLQPHVSLQSQHWINWKPLGSFKFDLPPIQDANKASEKQRNNGVSTLMFINPFDYKYSHDRCEGNSHLIKKTNKTSDQKEDKATKKGWERAYRKTIPDETCIVWVKMIVRRSKSNSCHTNVKASPSYFLTSQAVSINTDLTKLNFDWQRR